MRKLKALELSSQENLGGNVDAQFGLERFPFV